MCKQKNGACLKTIKYDAGEIAQNYKYRRDNKSC